MMRSLARLIFPIETDPLGRFEAERLQQRRKPVLHRNQACAAVRAPVRQRCAPRAAPAAQFGLRTRCVHTTGSECASMPCTIYGFRAAMQDMQTRMPQCCEVDGDALPP